jgi:hypothetical protein
MEVLPELLPCKNGWTFGIRVNQAALKEARVKMKQQE